MRGILLCYGNFQIVNEPYPLVDRYGGGVYTESVVNDKRTQKKGVAVC